MRLSVTSYLGTDLVLSAQHRCLHWSSMFPKAAVQYHTAACWGWHGKKQEEFPLKLCVIEPFRGWEL